MISSSPLKEKKKAVGAFIARKEKRKRMGLNPGEGGMERVDGCVREKASCPITRGKKRRSSIESKGEEEKAAHFSYFGKRKGKKAKSGEQNMGKACRRLSHALQRGRKEKGGDRDYSEVKGRKSPA